MDAEAEYEDDIDEGTESSFGFGVANISPREQPTPHIVTPSQVSQWALSDHGTYEACGDTSKVMAPAAYLVGLTSRGAIRFQEQVLKVDELIDFEGSIPAKIVADIENFWKLRQKFHDYGFLHRRGTFFYGPAGGGKTGLVNLVLHRTIAAGHVAFLCENPAIFVKGMQLFRRIEPERPITCVFEDIDALIERHGDADLLQWLDGNFRVDLTFNIACPSVDSLILKADLSWSRAGDLRTGDALVAFDEHSVGYGRKMRTAIVRSAPIIPKPCYRVITDRGETVVSEKHPFLVKMGNRPHVWREVENLNLNNRICFLFDPWKTDYTRDGGYLAGQYDGEGSLCFSQKTGRSMRVSWDQAVGPISQNMATLLESRDFEFARHIKDNPNCMRSPTTGKMISPATGKEYKLQECIYLKGRMWTAMRFLGSIRPNRLLSHPYLRNVWENVRLRVPKYARVIAVEPVGVRDVVALDTTTKTFIGDGMLQHNTSNYPEKLDRRLVSRPRRFDDVIRIDSPEEQLRINFFKHKMPHLSAADLSEWADYSKGFSFAAMTDLVIRVCCFNKSLEKAAKELRAMEESNPSSKEFSTGPSMGFGRRR